MGIGEIIVWLVIAAVVVLCIRDIAGNIKSGSCGGCSGGCSGSCASCSSSCRTADPEEVHRRIQAALQEKRKGSM